MRLLRAALAGIGCFVSELIPPRHVDLADALAQAEEGIEVWEPTPAAHGPAGASPAAGERSPQPRPAAGHLTSMDLYAARNIVYAFVRTQTFGASVTDRLYALAGRLADAAAATTPTP